MSSDFQMTDALKFLSLILLLFCDSFLKCEAKLKDGDCEVCIKSLEAFTAQITDDIRKDENKLDVAFRKFCKDLKHVKGKDRSKDERFCYYLGGLEESATGILQKVLRPISFFKPLEKICEDLKKMDSQICELKYEKQIDLVNVNLKKLKVKDLKKILSDWDQDQACKGCAEKSDFIKKIEELMPIYAPEAAKKREEL
ncbi:mesencephalic astrocyte-derived neurotrophic factor homolog [Gigantopelta aegis]|uniref:mesencephalic astrocyte-derived neurotrophic factor homolog n=1 Tax=Gigantopelta aegis TaxID=1735272 RepID=UPI001B88BA90|nr:mesencephalic astrocyte-derived neurotrophic factor homolog [Gigantopelta aegis]